MSEYEAIDYKNGYTLLNSSILNVSVKLKGLNEIGFSEKAMILKSGNGVPELQKEYLID